MSTSQPGAGQPERDSAAGDRMSLPSGALRVKKHVPSLSERIAQRGLDLLEHLGKIGKTSWQLILALFRRPLEFRQIIYQMEAVGVASLGLASITATFIGMVMAIQFAFGLQKFGGMEYTGRVIGLSFARELAPTLTAVIVGSRVAAGMAAEVGSMNVTEQVDAIRALGADPVKKLVLPRVIAMVLVMPLLGFFALALGFIGAMWITASQFSIPMGFFFRSALESVNMRDLAAGMCKTPFFGFIIAIIGCHYGLNTRGGTEGVGKSTTATVVAVSVTILISDFFLTKLFMAMF